MAVREKERKMISLKERKREEDEEKKIVKKQEGKGGGKGDYITEGGKQRGRWGDKNYKESGKGWRNKR